MLGRRRFTAAAIALAIFSTLLGGPDGLGPQFARALPAVIQVTTASDVVADEGLCSLREAIGASNLGGFTGVNTGECFGTSEIDRIQFSLGTGVPVITLGSSLPAISQAVNIRGATGGATQVRLAGPDGGTGLQVNATATGTTIRGLRIDGFSTGIWSLAANVTIAGNWIGPNSQDGVSANGANTTIGGTNTLDATSPCSGDCNLIKGNAHYGLYLNSSGTVSGNFIGIDALGSVATSATANGTGVVVTQGAWTIGGTVAGQGNLVSGNTGTGLSLYMCSCLVQGNSIGTNLAGTAKVKNGGNGINTNGQGSIIGGSTAGAGNLISGNGGDGIRFEDRGASSSNLTVYGNHIGTTAGGAALGNSGSGIFVGGFDSNLVTNATIGNPSLPGAANVIAHNGSSGVFVHDNAKQIQFRGNSIHDNDVADPEGIFVFPGSNESIAPPTITGTGPLHGTACTGCTVDIYSDSADEGRIYHGAVAADGSGDWSFPGSLTGPKVTATATNATHSTSMFSVPFTLPGAGKRPDGRIRKGSGSLVGNDVYNTTGVNQTKTGSTTRGSTITFNISIQNDAGSDQFTVLATGAGTSSYTVNYFRNSTDITAAVVGGTYTTPVLAKGATFVISAKVKVKSTATPGSNVTRLLTISSVGDPTRKDAVKLIVKRS